MTTNETIDLGPAARRLADVVEGVRDDQLQAPTPCADANVADLLDHVDGLAQGFTAAAEKRQLEGSQGPRADGSRLGDGWRPRIRARLDALTAAWRDPAAWEGMTQAGGLDLPGEVAGLVALNEVIVHGWDLAAATGQPYDCDARLVEAAMGFVRSAVAQNPEGSPGLFGPPVTAPDDAPPLARLVALTGRRPDWTAPPLDRAADRA